MTPAAAPGRAKAPTLSRFDRRAIAGFVGGALALFVLDRLNRATGLDSAVLDIGGEHNVVTWFSSVQFAVAALVAGVALGTGAARASVWGPIAAAMAIFSVDEVTMLHERVEDAAGDWVVEVLEPLVALALVLVAVHVLRAVGRRERLLLVAAAGALLAAQATAAFNGGDLPSVLANGLSAGEEMLEVLSGSFVLVAALPLAAAGLRRRLGGAPGGA
jgi:hypothetical protein